MADNEVNVKIGTDTSGVDSGVEHVKQKEGEVKDSTEQLREEFREFRAFMIEAFAVDKIAEFIDKMTELGEQAQLTSQMTGLSVAQVQQLGFAAQMTGQSGESVTMMLERLDRNMADAQDKTNIAAKAFASLGLSYDQLRKMSPADVLNKIADAFEKAPDGADKTAIATDLLGRSGARMIPILDQGSQGLRQMGIQAEATGTILSDLQSKQLQETHDKIIESKLAIEGFGLSLVDFLRPAIDQSVEDLTHFFEALGDDVRQGGVFHEVIVQLVDIFEIFIGVAKTLTVTMATLGALVYDAAHGEFRDMKNVMHDAASQIEKDWSKIDTIVQTANGNMQQATEHTEQAIKQLTALHAPSSGNSNDVDKGALADISAQQAIAKANLQTQIALLQQYAAYHQLTKTQEIEQEKRAADAEYAIDQSALEKKLDLYKVDSDEYKKTINQMDVLEAQHTAKIAQYDAKIAQANVNASKETYQNWLSTLNPIESAFDGMVQGILSGTETISQAMANAFASMAISVIESLLKIIAEWLVFEAVTEGQGSWSDFVAVAGGKSGGGSFLGGIGNILGFAEGTNYVPYTGLYQLHEGEIVVPPGDSAAIRSGQGGGDNVNVTFVLQSIDTQTGTQFLKNNMGTIAQGIAGQMRNQSSAIGKAMRGST